MPVVGKQSQIDEIIKSGRDIKHFVRTYVKIEHPKRGLVPFELYPFQENVLDSLIEHRLNIVLKARQLGISTTTAAFALWLAIFHKHKSVLIIATKLPVAMNMIRKVDTMLRYVPKWLVLPNVISRTKQTIEFSNGSWIKAIPTSEDAGRSEGLSCLIVDECVAGDTKIMIRNKFTGEIRNVMINELYNEEYK